MTDCDQLLDGHCYVCSSTPVFKPLDYENIETASWVLSTKKSRTSAGFSADTAMRQRSSTGILINNLINEIHSYLIAICSMFLLLGCAPALS